MVRSLTVSIVLVLILLVVLTVWMMRPFMTIADRAQESVAVSRNQAFLPEPERQHRHGVGIGLDHSHADQESGEHSHDHDLPIATVNAPNWPSALMLPALDGPTPWSDKPILDDPDRFHIAIMTDNTGGHRPGIWMKAIERLNLLRPQFVMSVGDLIEGYTDDRNQIESQWQEFLGFIQQMQMKFFFVAGNHDLSNAIMHEIWRKHFGPEWYSFDYRGVHFICLNSEDPDNRLGEKQIEWIRNDLEESVDARWTLLFFHQPLWLTAERAKTAGNPDPTNWSQVEGLLGSRPHTVFAGHVHHYVQYDRYGAKYYHLATTGGASALRGVSYGEFDHVTWLTMENDGPHIANLLLDGILPPDAVTEPGIARFRNFLSQTRLEVAPILVDDTDGFSEGRVELRLSNGLDVPVTVAGRIDGLPLRGLHVQPADLNISANPGQTAELSVHIRFAERIEFDHLAGTLLTARLKTVENDSLSAERTVPVIIDRRLICSPTPESLAIDGSAQEWNNLAYTTPLQPLLLGPSEQWQGAGDASISFSISHDGDHLYFAGRVTDDTLVSGDAIELRIDPRPIDVRVSNGGQADKAFLIRLTAPDGMDKTELTIRGPRELSGTVGAGKRTDRGYDFEVSIPINMVMADQGLHWQTFQATTAVVDVDSATEKPIRALWRGTSDWDKRNINWGQFSRRQP